LAAELVVIPGPEIGLVAEISAPDAADLDTDCFFEG